MNFFGRISVVLPGSQWVCCFSVGLTVDGRRCQTLSWIRDRSRQTYVLPAFVLVVFFLSVWNIIFISLHSEWQLVEIARQRGIFMTFCGAAFSSLLHLLVSFTRSQAHFSSLPAFLFFLPSFLYFSMTLLLKLLSLCYSLAEVYRE